MRALTASLRHLKSRYRKMWHYKILYWVLEVNYITIYVTIQTETPTRIILNRQAYHLMRNLIPKNINNWSSLGNIFGCFFQSLLQTKTSANVTETYPVSFLMPVTVSFKNYCIFHLIWLFKDTGITVSGKHKTVTIKLLALYWMLIKEAYNSINLIEPQLLIVLQ